MPRTADDVESYLHELGRHFDNDGGTYILRTGVAETPVAIRVEPPIVELTVTIGKVPAEDAARLELFRKLLEFNAMDLMLASYGVTDGVVLLSAALALENLDRNELDFALSDIDLALARHVPKLHDVAGR
jgi:hypothetical protein